MSPQTKRPEAAMRPRRTSRAALKALSFRPMQPLAKPANIAALTPDKLNGLSIPQIATLPIHLDGVRLTVGDIFQLSGEDTQNLHFWDCSGQLRHVGQDMTQGRIEIHGNASHFAGQGMSGGLLRIRGDTGHFAGHRMSGGFLCIHGDAGDWLGASLPGELYGMNGGIVHVRGHAGERLADRMRRGIIVIDGNCGDYPASRMKAGTVILLGKPGLYPGMGMRRGSLLIPRRSWKQAHRLVPSFRDCGTLRLPFLHMLLTSVSNQARCMDRELCDGFEVFRRFGNRFGYLRGDLACGGKGEILLLEFA
ncbi:MAG: formylmethanofuran dehydrogenase subunit C [Candidatus Eutrophobiaceae bacterium]